MGRSVMVAPNASSVSFLHHELEDEYDYDDLISNLRCEIQATFPSFISNDHWLGREIRVIVSCNLADVTVSHYGDLFAICIVPRDCYSNIADNWIRNIEKKFRAIVYQFGKGLVPVATASNGETFFREVS